MISRHFHTAIIHFALGCSLLFATGCQSQSPAGQPVEDKLYHNEEILTGAERMHIYLPQIEHLKVGLVVNQTSLLGNSHLADSLLDLGIDVVRIFAPEHGFRGTADAGETVQDGIDIKTGLPIISLYGKNKKPFPDQLEGLDVIIFDIQDVGARFYTYISTMHYVMEAAAENNIPVIVLDRPNPNGHYVAGPVLDTSGYRSFVGMHAVPIVHGMTVGEYAQMINGEGWLNGGVQCELTVVTCDGYDHKKFYKLPIKPSPNLPNMASIYLYPALCLFEGTVMSVGRGTDAQFQVVGGPDFQPELADITFTPRPKPGAKYPRHDGIECRGIDLMDYDIRALRLNNLAPEIYRTVYNAHTGEEDFFISFFDKLAGGNTLRKAIAKGTSIEELYDIYSEGIETFLPVRKQYLLYADFDE